MINNDFGTNEDGLKLTFCHGTPPVLLYVGTRIDSWQYNRMRLDDMDVMFKLLIIPLPNLYKGDFYQVGSK